MKLPVSFAPNITSDIINGTTNKVPLQKPTNHDRDSHDAGPEYFYVRRDKFGSTKQFLRALKPVVFFGRCFGVLSRGDVLDKEKSNNKITFSTVLSACFSLFLLVNAILMIRLNIRQFQKDKTTLVRTEGFCHSGYACVMFFVYSYQLFATQRFRNIVHNFIKANEWSHLSNHKGPDNKWFCQFPLACGLIMTASMLLGMAENILYDIQRLAQPPTGIFWNLSNLQLYYIQTFKHWHDILPSYISPVTIIFVTMVKICTWGWIYTDIIPMVLCRALWEKLRMIDQSLAADLSALSAGKKDVNHEELFITAAAGKKRHPVAKIMSQNLDDYQAEYLVLTDLVKQVQTYVSPLILVNYACNLYIVVVMLFHWTGPLANVRTYQQSIYVGFAFFQFCYRIAAVTYFAAEVHQMNMSIKEKIQKSPNDLYSIAVERLERTLQCNPAGICLLGSFMITRHFFASMIVIISIIQILLLQTYAGYVQG